MDFELLRGKAKVVFTKKDGTERTMYCTKNMELLSESQKVYAMPSGNGAKKEGVISVWDFEKEGWRSFRPESVKSIEVWA